MRKINCSIRAHSLLVLTMLLSLQIGSVQAASPVKNDLCKFDSTTGEELNSGARMSCKTDNILKQQDQAIDRLDLLLPELSDDAINAMDKHYLRAKKAKGHTKQKGFKQLTRKSDPNCYFVEFKPTEDSDGICEGNEICAEVIDDGIGDDDGECDTKGPKKKREVCAQICDNNTLNDDDENFDGEITEDLEDLIDEGADQIYTLNVAMEDGVKSMIAFQALMASGESCDFMADPRPDTTWANIASTTAVTLRGVAGQVGTTCDLDVAGFNAAPVCLVFETAAALAELVDDAVKFYDSEIDSQTLDANFLCLKKVEASQGDAEEMLKALQKSVSDLRAEVDSLHTKVDEANTKLDDVLTLLVTPQGRRPNFPEK
jgi:hypothetical protein